jgi:hypothetical protein
MITLFFMLGWDRYGFNKKSNGTHYAELVFLHPFGYAGCVVHSGVSGARSVDTFSCLGGRCGFQKKCTRTRYVQLVFSHPVGFAGHVVPSGELRNVIVLLFMLGWGQYLFDKKHPNKLRGICVFASRGIYGSHSAFWCHRGAKWGGHYFSCLGGTGMD